MTQRLVPLILVALIAAASCNQSSGDGAWPVDKVQIYVPAKPGGATDAAARTFSRYLRKHGRVAVTVINQTGGGGVVALQTVADSPPDGGTLLMFHSMIHASHLLGRTDLSYRDFTSLAIIAENNDVYVAREDAAFDNLTELLPYAASADTKPMIGSQLGGSTQVKAMALSRAASDSLRIVDSGSEAQRVAALLGGQIDVTIISVKSALQFEKAGKFKVLGVLNSEPDSFAPDWPTAPEQGIDVDFPLAFTLYAPPSMPIETRDTIAEIVEDIVADPDYRAAVTTDKQRVHYLNAKASDAYLETEFKFVKSMISQ